MLQFEIVAFSCLDSLFSLRVDHELTSTVACVCSLRFNPDSFQLPLFGKLFDIQIMRCLCFRCY